MKNTPLLSYISVQCSVVLEPSCSVEMLGVGGENQFLSHHYVLRRSVVFIVDTECSSVFYHYMANRQVKKFFKKLDDQDYFGYISLGEKSISD